MNRARKPGESFADYREAQDKEERLTREYLKGIGAPTVTAREMLMMQAKQISEQATKIRELTEQRDEYERILDDLDHRPDQ